VAETPADVFFHRLDSILERAPAAYSRALRPVLSGFRSQVDGPPDASQWSPDFAQALTQGLTDGMAAIRAAAGASSGSEGLGWRALGARVDRASPNALTRAARAFVGLGAPTRDDVLCLTCDHDEGGRPLSGDDAYRIHFPHDALPPVHAFWTLAPEPEGSFSHRSSIGDRSELALNADRSLDVIVQSSPPQAEQIANWLPSPPGRFSLTARLYWPRDEALNGGWRMPPVERLGSGGNRRLRERPPPKPRFLPPPVNELRRPLVAWRMSP
jgi:hypothetical protein